MHRPEGSERFLERTSALGVVDVRCSDSAYLVVVTDPHTDDERMDSIRILARIEWPGRSIVVAKRAPHHERESGTGFASPKR